MLDIRRPSFNCTALARAELFGRKEWSGGLFQSPRIHAVAGVGHDQPDIATALRRDLDPVRLDRQNPAIRYCIAGIDQQI
jgi:hypothetical protein